MLEVGADVLPEEPTFVAVATILLATAEPLGLLD